MQNFEYASPSTLKDATALLGGSWADAQVLALGDVVLGLVAHLGDDHDPPLGQHGRRQGQRFEGFGGDVGAGASTRGRRAVVRPWTAFTP